MAIFLRVALLLLALFVGDPASAQQIVLPCVPAGNSCIPVSSANPLPVTGGTAATVVVGTSVVSGGTANQLLYDNAGVLGEVTVGNSCVYLTSGAGVPSCSTTIPPVTLTTPTLGVATATSLATGGCTISANAFCVTGSTALAATTLSAALTYGGVTLSNAVTGTGNMVLSAAPTLTGAVTFSGSIVNTGIASDTGLTDASVCTATTTGGGGVVGQFYKGTGTIGICLGTSSARYKHDIVELPVGLNEIMKLTPVEYKLNADHGDPNKPLYGFIAEESLGVLPKLVGVDASGRPNTMDYLGLVPVLVRAVQQQQVEIAALKEKIH